jgi:hypothetical protein
MSDGELALFGPFLAQSGHITDVLVVSGVIVAIEAGGVGVVDHASGIPGVTQSIGAGKKPYINAATVSAGGTTWLIYNTPPPDGIYPVEGGVVSFTINGSGQTTFTQASPSYDSSLSSPVSLAVANNTSVWVALSSNEPGTPSRIDRIWAPPRGRLTGPGPASYSSSVELPSGWQPKRITAGPPAASAKGPGPGFLYLLGEDHGHLFLARVELTLAATPQVSILAWLAVGGAANHLIRAADGSAWAVGNLDSTGWLVRGQTGSDNSSAWKKLKHRYRSLVEGHEGTNPSGNNYRSMFLCRNFVDADLDQQSDIVTFRDDPESGVGWVTAPETKWNPTLSQYVAPKITINSLSARMDSQGRYWFAYLAPGETGNVYGTGSFKPPEGDPLDQP